jgi:hypothetical protein
LQLPFKLGSFLCLPLFPYDISKSLVFLFFL